MSVRDEDVETRNLRRGGSKLRLSPGNLVGRFTIVEKLGEGGMGVVYLAHDPSADRKVALKLLATGGYEPGPAGQTRQFREAQAMARLRHVNVVTIYEVGTHDDTVYLAMEFVEGGTLAKWLRDKPPWQDIVRVLRAAGEGLAAAHAAGMVHRDFKPDNVLVGSDGQVCVADFGLARDFDATGGAVAITPAEISPRTSPLATPVTHAGTVLGTPAYMSPEQARGETLDGRSDQFSFCAVLYEALFGTRPFAKTSLDADYAPVPDDRGIPRRVRDAITRGLAKHRDDRFASMRALLDALAPVTRAKRWPWIAVAAAGLVTGGLAAALHGRSVPRDPEVCARPLAGVWDDAITAKITARLTQLGVPDSTWRPAKSWLDAHAARVAVGYAAACAAQATERDLRLDCLAEPRLHLKVIGEVLADADAETAKLVSGFSRLTVSELTCADASSLALVPKPANPPAVEAMQRRIVLTQAKEAVDLEAADRQYRSLVTDAEALAYPPVALEALEAYGNMLAQRREYRRALEIHQNAIAIADAARLDTYASVFASEDAADHALLGDPVDEPLAQAKARLARASHSIVAENVYEGNLAIVLQGTGHARESVPHFERAIELEKAMYPPSQELALRINNLGGALESLGEYERSARTSEDALTVYNASPGAPNNGVKRGIQTNLVWVYAGLGRTKQARAIAEDMVRVADQYEDDAMTAIAESFLANLLIADGEREAGVKMIERALAGLKKLKLDAGGESLEVDRQAAIAYDSLGRTSEAREHAASFMAHAKTILGADSDDWAPYLMTSGLVALHAHDLPMARAQLSRALAISKQRPLYPGWVPAIEKALALTNSYE
ncbi:MAG: protein kinase [Kofleriaceae bacterium]